MPNELEPKPHSLWDLMRRPAAVPSADAPTPDKLADQQAEAESHAAGASPGKGLWAMMGVQAPVLPESAIVEPSVSEVEENASAAPPPAWFRGKTEMESPANEAEPLSEELEPLSVHDPSSAIKVPVPKPIFAPPPQVVAEPHPFAIDAPRPEARPSPFKAKKKEPSRGAFWSVLVGALALPMTLFAAMPEIWARLPATILGLGSLVLGVMSYSEIQRSKGRQSGTGLAMTGMALGTIAMFLGPLVVAPWSQRQSVAGSRATTERHLKSLGVALGKYHNQNGHFPAGATYRAEESGERTALHSWMTDLLPYLDAQSTYQAIRRDEAWSEPVNKPPMSKSIPAFLVGGVDETHNSSGYALSHFAGVGGQATTSDGQVVNVGIFDGGSKVSRADITDELSNTLIIGEIPDGYRPWGEPGNWRTLSDGLNRGTGSFGNAAGTGAMFLRADGSVSFLSNQIAPDVLKRLSTRDADDDGLIPKKYR